MSSLHWPHNDACSLIPCFCSQVVVTHFPPALLSDQLFSRCWHWSWRTGWWWTAAERSHWQHRIKCLIPLISIRLTVSLSSLTLHQDITRRQETAETEANKHGIYVCTINYCCVFIIFPFKFKESIIKLWNMTPTYSLQSGLNGHLCLKKINYY